VVFLTDFGPQNLDSRVYYPTGQEKREDELQPTNIKA
jgi:hypothetical protein